MTVLSALLHVGPLLVLAVLSWGAVRSFGGRTAQRLAAILSREASRAVGRQVRIGSVAVVPAGLELHDVRLSGRSARDPETLRAHRAIARIDWRSLFSPHSASDPYVSSVEVSGPILYLRRDSRGRWDVEDLVRARGAGGGRPVIGHVRIARGELRVIDEIPAAGARTRGSLDLHFVRVEADLAIATSGFWGKASAELIGGPARRLSLVGSWTSEAGAGWARISATSVELSRLSPAIGSLSVRTPAGQADISALALLRARQGGVYLEGLDGRALVRGACMDWQGRGRIASELNGVALFGLQGAHFAGQGKYAGCAATVAVAVRDFHDPWITASAKVIGMDLRRGLGVLGVSARSFLPDGMRATVNATVGVAGRPNALRLDARGPATIEGAALRGLTVTRPLRLAVQVAGPIGSPSVAFSGAGARLSYRAQALDVARLDGRWGAGRLVAVVAGRIAGGRLSGTLAVRPGKDGLEWRARGRAAGIELASLALPEGTGPWAAVAGSALARFDLWGAPALRVPAGRLRVQVSDLKLDDMSAEAFDLGVDSDGSLVHIGSLDVSAPGRWLSVHGLVDVEDRTLDLMASADGLALSEIVEPIATGATDGILGGVTLQSCRVSGSMAHPTIEASAQVHSPGVGRASLDDLDLSVYGDPDRLWVEADARRLPAEAHLMGSIRRPFSSGATVQLTGEIDSVELQDLVRAAGLSTDIGGAASGELRISGRLGRPVVELPKVTLENAFVGPFEIGGIEAALRAEHGVGGYELICDGLRADALGGRLTASGSVGAGGEFGLRASLEGLPVAQVLAKLGRQDAIGGAAMARLDLAGRLGGRSPLVLGACRLGVTGLTYHSEPLGDLRVALQSDGSTVSGAAGEPALELEGPIGSAVRISSATWRQSDGSVRAQGRLEGLRAEALKRIICGFAGTDWTSTLPEAAEGVVSGTLAIAGGLDRPTAAVDLQGDGVALAGVRLDRLRCRANVGRGAVEIEELSAEGEGAALAARGALQSDGRLAGELEVNNLPLRLASRWAGPTSMMSRLRGSLDNVTATVGGTLARPVVTATADASDLSLESAPGAPSGGAIVRRLRIGRVDVAEGKASVTDVSARLADPVRGTGAGRVFEIGAAGTMDFTWGQPHVADASIADISVQVPEQDLKLLNILWPGMTTEMAGRIQARLQYRGPAGGLRDPNRALTRSGAGSVLSGSLKVTAGSLRFAKAQTQISDLRADLTFAGDRVIVPTGGFEMMVGRPAATKSGASPAWGKLVAEGELPLFGGGAANGLAIRSDRFTLSEDVLPYFGSGRIRAEVAGDLPASPGSAAPPGVDLRVTGSILAPRISGDIRIRDAIFRPPDGMPVVTQEATSLPVSPSVDLRVHAGDGVRVSVAQLNARVRTPYGSPITVTGPIDGVRMNGTLLVESGTLAFPTARFAVRPGGVVRLLYPAVSAFVGDDPFLGAFVDISATTRLTAASVTGERKRYSITVDATGPINSGAPPLVAGSGALADEAALRLAFRTDPPDLALSGTSLQRRVTGLLGGQDALEGLFRRDADVGRLLGEKAVDALSSSFLPEMVDRTGIAQALGLDALDVDYNGLEAFTLRLSKRLIGPFDISYWRWFAGPRSFSSADGAEWELKLSQRLQRGLQLSWQTDSLAANAIRLEGVFRF